MGSDVVPDSDEEEQIMNRYANETEPQPGPSNTAPQSAKKPTKSKKKEKKKDVLKWDQSTTGTAWKTPEWLGTMDTATIIKAPVEYFKSFCLQMFLSTLWTKILFT